MQETHWSPTGIANFEVLQHPAVGGPERLHRPRLRRQGADHPLIGRSERGQRHVRPLVEVTGLRVDLRNSRIAPGQNPRPSELMSPDSEPLAVGSVGAVPGWLMAEGAGVRDGQFDPLAANVAVMRLAAFLEGRTVAAGSALDEIGSVIGTHLDAVGTLAAEGTV
jgi:hypothetical protein